MDQTAADILTGLLAGGDGSREHPVRVSRDFWEEPADQDEFTALHRAFHQEYENQVEQVRQAWGRPDFEGDWQTEGFPDEYDALEMAYWLRGEHIAYVAFRHSDKELPMMVVLGALCPTERDTNAT